jgi:hypothetical protein
LTEVRDASTLTAVRRGVSLFVLLVSALPLVAGCPATQPPPAPGYDLGPDGYVAPRVDTDADGLCDGTELALGLDPTLADTDADGYPDWFELAAGYRATAPASPPREEVVVLPETADGAVTVSIATSVRGAGETFSGGFDAQLIRDPYGATAGNFFVSARAVAAEPPGHVTRIDEASRSFVGVRGRTLLFSEVRLAFGTNTPLSCVRAYPFRYYLKTDTGRTVAAPRRLVLVLPPGMTAATGPWCAASGPCW